MMRCFVVGFVLAAGVSAMAGEVEHTVHPGESVSLISQRYYGDFDGAEILLRYNGLGDATIRPGQTLRVPYSEIHEIRPGDSWSVLARRYLGSVSAWPAIAVLNDRPPEAPLTVGLRVRMPVVLSRELRPGDTLASLAQRYYGDAARSDLVREFNDIEDPRRLAVGQVLELPLLAPALKERAAEREPVAIEAPARGAGVPTGEPPASKATEPQAPGTEETVEAVSPVLFTEELAEANRMFASGDYAQVRERLEEVRPRIVAEGAVEDRVTLWRLLAFVYVAFDLEGQACDCFRSLTRIAPDNEFDPDLVSPKIRKRLGACPRTEG